MLPLRRLGCVICFVAVLLRTIFVLFLFIIRYQRAMMTRCRTLFGQVPWHSMAIPMGDHVACHGIAMRIAMARQMEMSCHAMAIPLIMRHGIAMALPWRCSKTCHGIARHVVAQRWSRTGRCATTYLGESMGVLYCRYVIMPWQCHRQLWRCHDTPWSLMVIPRVTMVMPRPPSWSCHGKPQKNRGHP